MRPKFNADTSYIQLSDSIYFRGNRSFLRLKGKSLYRLVEHLIPFLDGRYTLEEITRGLDADRKKMITNLVETLLHHHFLKDISQDSPHTLTQAELATYSSEISFIDSFQASAAYRFESFRNQHLLVIGSRLSLIALMQASLRSGVRKINVIITPESGSIQEVQADVLDLFSEAKSKDNPAKDDPEQIVQLIDAPHWDNVAEVLNTIQQYDAVLHISDQPMLARAQMLNKLCVEQKKTFIQAILVDDHAWVGPLVSPETEGCWECAWRRLQSNLTNVSEQLPHYEFHDYIIASSNQFFTKPAAAIVANQLIFELFKHFTQAESEETVRYLVDIQLETLLSKSHVFLPHPLCEACQHPGVPTETQFLEQVQQLQSQDPINPDIFLENIGRCVDNRLGLFTTIDQDDFVQIPLGVCKANISNPMLLKRPYHAQEIIEVGKDMPDARLSVCLQACERYAADLVDRRRLLPLEAISQHASSTIEADRLLGVKPLRTDVETWSWAMDLYTYEACLIPAQLIFPSLENREQGAERERGIGSGMSWAEAICQALLDWCTYLTIERLSESQDPCAQVDLALAPMKPEGAHFYHLLQAVGAEITVYDVTGALQVPTFAICLGERVVAYSAHWDVAQALSVGIERAMQHYQATQTQQPEYDMAPVPDFPLALRGDHLHVPYENMLPEELSTHQEWLLQKLQDNKLRALALPLNYDPALMQVLPYVVRVLLARA